MSEPIPIRQVSRNDDAAPLTAQQRRSLRSLAACMIPADAEYGVPGADDAPIVRDMLASMAADAPAIAEALDTLDGLAGGDFSGLPEEDRQTVAQAFLSVPTPQLALLGALVLQCYYRDDRVMRSLGMELRPPFPKGFEVEQGDWSLLDPVRSRAPLYRKAP